MQAIRQGVFWLVCAFLSLTVHAQNSSYVAQNAPETYIVQPGDTLWDIAGRFLNEPWRWREIWHASPNIQNPDLIYPGDQISLSQDAAGNPTLSVTRAESVPPTRTYLPNGVVKLSPRVRSLPAKRAIPTLPIDVIGPFLNASQVVTEAAFNAAPKVVALDEDHLAVSEGMRIYVQGLPKNDVTGFTLFRKGKVYRHPKTKAILGVEAEVLGIADIFRRGTPLTTLKITKSYSEVLIGDKVMPLQEDELAPYFVPKLPQKPANGYIISVFGGLNQIGQYQVVTITGGEDISREPGDVLLVYQTQQDVQKRFSNLEAPPQIPPDYIGEIMVFRVFNKVSFGLVMKAFRTIYLLDEVRSP